MLLGNLCFLPADAHGKVCRNRLVPMLAAQGTGRDLSPLCCLHLCSALKTQRLNSRSKAGSRPGFSLGSLEGGLPAALCSGLLVSWGVHDSSRARLAWGTSVLTAQDSSVTAAAGSGPWAGRLEGLVFSSLFVSFPALPLNFMSYDIP